jgi:hypothetical protein
MNKLLILPIFFLTMCAPAPVTDPPAHAMEVEEELMWKALEYIQNYNMLQNKTEPNDAINSALDNFLEDSYGSNDPTESEELLQLPSDGD